jgi:hypothetical protein
MVLQIAIIATIIPVSKNPLFLEFKMEHLKKNQSDWG